MTHPDQRQSRELEETPARPRYEGQAWPPPDDEISLFDIFDALVRRRWLIVGVAAVVTALALAYALVQPDTYRYRQVLEVGSRLIDGDIRLIESPTSVAAKLNQNYIPAETHDWVNAHSGTEWEPEVKASVPEEAQIVVLTATGTTERAPALTQVMERASSAMAEDHSRVLETLQEEMQARLTSLRNQIAAAREKRDRLQARLQRVDEREALVRNQISELEDSIAAAEKSRRQATQNLDGAAQAMTLLMLSNELRAARERLANLRTTLRVNLANTRDQLSGQIADQKRRIESKRAQVNVQQVRIDNLSRTQALSAPQQSLTQAGTSGSLILALGLVLGGMLGVFSGFVAEFIAAARRRHQPAADEQAIEHQS